MVGALCYIYRLLHFSLMRAVGLTGQYFSVLYGYRVSFGPAMNSYSCWFIQVCMFFESLAKCSLGFTYVCVAAVDVTRDVMDGSTLMARQTVSALGDVMHIWWWHGKLCLHLTVSCAFDDGLVNCFCTWRCHPHLMMAWQAVSALDGVIHIWWRQGKLCLHLKVSSTFYDGMASCVCTWQCHPHFMMAWQAVSTPDSVIHIWWRQGKLCLHLTVASTFDDGMASCVCTWRCHPLFMTAWQAVSALDSVIHIL